MALSVKQIGREYNEEMLNILRNSPMVSDGISLCLDRSPDMFLVPELFFDEFKAFGFFKEEKLAGFGMICEKEVYVNGVPKLVGYFANLYVKKEARKLGWLYKASKPLFGEIMQKTNLGFATTVQGNRATESMIGRRISKFPMMPYSASIGLYLIKNILVTFRKSENIAVKRGVEVRTAREDDLGAIAELLNNEYKTRLFGNVLSREKLSELIATRPGFDIGDYYVAEQNGDILGVCSAWDVKGIRKIRVTEYHKQFLWAYRAYSIFRPVFRFPKLPRRGEAFKEIIVNDFACHNRDPEILEILLIHVYNKARKSGYNMIQVGSYAGDPILKATKPFFTQALYSHIVAGASDQSLILDNKIDITRPFIDIALT